MRRTKASAPGKFSAHITERRRKKQVEPCCCTAFYIPGEKRTEGFGMPDPGGSVMLSVRKCKDSRVGLFKMEKTTGGLHIDIKKIMTRERGQEKETRAVR